IGMEVIVEFLNGDPDYPIVTGCVYNGQNTPPYLLPHNKTISTFKTDTHQGSGFNELRFQDENGLQEVFIHAQKDRNEKTRNNHTERIDNNWVQSIGHNKAIEVRNNHVEQIGGNLSLSVGPGGIGQLVSRAFTGMTDGISNLGYNLGVPGGVNPGEGNMHIAVEKSKSETIGTVSRAHVGMGYSLTAGQSIEMTSGRTFGVTVAERASEEVGSTKTINVGERFTIICGSTRIVMHASGLIKMTGTDLDVQMANTITMVAGSDITLHAGGKMDLEAGEKIDAASQVVNIDAGAGMTLQAGGNLDLSGLVINLN
ncbi:MAG: bacteriophage T4 gp5 trimerization domain-containing protein, partial [Marivita sp.]|uniref:bacteriophage T4 gp5 trimerisation domain-containing protein n=1 Tax=Marivita sp. TaxID=2003365 RepID=UPI003EF80C16